MLLLGLLLLAATGVFTGLLASENWAGGPDYTVTMFGNTLGTLNSLQIFLAGIALTLVFCLGVAMAALGSRQARRRRAARHAVVREATQARAERDALAARLDAEQRDALAARLDAEQRDALAARLDAEQLGGPGADAVAADDPMVPKRHEVLSD
jgi:hypothetical protein